MGAWGVGNFENDFALDWMIDFLESEDKMHILKDTFEVAKERSNFLAKLFKRDFELEAPEANAILAAGEVISLILGTPSADLPVELKEWAKKNQLKLNKNIVNDALKAIRSVRQNSELNLLWEETDDYQTWLDIVRNLENRISK
jgi:hypothetical protein